jgi:hypothetical protein
MPLAAPVTRAVRPASGALGEGVDMVHDGRPDDLARSVGSGYTVRSQGMV